MLVRGHSIKPDQGSDLDAPSTPIHRIRFLRDFMSQLFSPYKFRGLSVPNRIAVSPMCQYWAANGLASAWHMIHLGGLASSGAGMLFIEATAVEPEGRITPGDVGLWNSPTEAAWRIVFEELRRYSTIGLVMQLGHAGRKASSEVPWKGGQLIAPSEGGWPTVGPSALAHKDGEIAPAALDKGGLRRIREAFVSAAERAVRLGVDGLELHAAHGYLLHQFLSPLANRRTDEYGGSLANRMRYVLEVFDAVREVVPTETPIGVKVSATDWVEAGWDLEQTIELARELKRREVDWISVSSGGVSPLQKITPAPGYQLSLSQAIKEATGVSTIGVGLITEAQQAEEAIATGKADLVALGRAMLYDPRWGWHAAAELGASVDAPPPYWRAPPAAQSKIFRSAHFGAR